MTGGPRYWNEESQRWEEPEEGVPGAAGTGPDAPPATGGDTAGVPSPGDGAPSAEATPEGADGAGAPSPAGGAVPGAAPPAVGPGPGADAAPGVPPHPAHPGVPPFAPTLTDVRRPGAVTAAGRSPVPAPRAVPEPPRAPSRPPGVPAPVPAGPRGTGRRRVWSVVGGAAAVGAVAGLVLTLVPGDGEGRDGRADDGAVPASASRTPGTTAPGSPAPGPRETPAEETSPPSTPADGLPAGYEPYTDPEGFTLARPTGWTRTAGSSLHGIDVVHYRSPDGGHRLQVFEVSEASPGASHELFLSDTVAKAPGFTRLSLESPDDGGPARSRLEYLVDSIEGEPDVGTWHVVDERFLAADGRIYAVAAYGADADGREDERELLRTALARFCPPHTACGTGTGAG
ncbi:hypothetical protein [Streptomyces sp. Tu 3180]|uniref:hypothetical protein n=1 Tax=Streptomyces sp. Tu 3180 TaxID=2682611 RepID=UPI0013584BD1|nr:hypothetical protein [Streptomyces sp. Tu 3180]KAF3467102.1 hypothetical protein GL259_24190 [Streptomyces sp. Tu 3180]